MTIYARYMGELVEVTASWESARRKVASIRTVSDFRKPFTLWSMGGPVDSAEITVPFTFLHDLSVSDNGNLPEGCVNCPWQHDNCTWCGAR